MKSLESALTRLFQHIIALKVLVFFAKITELTLPDSFHDFFVSVFIISYILYLVWTFIVRTKKRRSEQSELFESSIENQ